MAPDPDFQSQLTVVTPADVDDKTENYKLEEAGGIRDSMPPQVQSTEEHHQHNHIRKTSSSASIATQDDIRGDGGEKGPGGKLGIADDEFLSRVKTKGCVIGFEGDDDPENPRNYPRKRKWAIIGLISSVTLICPLASSMFAPAVIFMDDEFHNTNGLLTGFVVSVFLLGFVVGPLFLAPLSEIYGRAPVLHFANSFFVVWQIGCALAPNLGSLIAFRFLGGIGGSACLTIGGGIISDLFDASERGKASGIWSLGPLMGPVLGPITGGFIGQRIGWRWVFWILLIAGFVVTASLFFFLSETNPEVIIARKVKRLRKETGRDDLISFFDHERGGVRSPIEHLKRGLIVPLKLLFRSPIVFILSMYMSAAYGLLYLLFTTIPSVFEGAYGWEPEITGLAYLGIFFGFLSGMFIVAGTVDGTANRLTAKNNGVREPEFRLPACLFFACFLPISFFWYGWAADKHVHWSVAILGTVPFSFGMMGLFLPIQTYVIDAFPQYAASGVATLTASRSLVGALLPLAGQPLYESLGLGWGNSLLGFVALAMIPAPYLIYKYGKAIRTRWPLVL